MPQHDAKDAQGKAPPEPPARGDSLRDKVATAVFGFLLTGVVGTMVATWFQQRGWAWQSQVAQVEKDTASALDSLNSVSNLLDKRWSATLQMASAIENKTEGDEAKAIRDTFLSVNNAWELQYADVDATVEFNVDRPFGVDAARLPDAVYSFGCQAFPFDAAAANAIDPKSAHTVLTVINNCEGIVKDKLSSLGKAANGDAATKKVLDETFFVLSNIYYMNDALRCVILERAVAMRRSLDAELTLGSFFQIGPRIYKIPVKESDCFAVYKDWSAKNPPKQQ
jgi:hypothetical protein